MEKKIKIYSCSPSNLPSNIEIKKLNSSGDNLKLLILSEKCFTDKDYVTSIDLCLKMDGYAAKFGAIDKNTGALVGACLLIDKSVSLKQKYGTKYTANKVMILDFLFVDPKYQNQKIATNLINQAYEFCGENGYSKIQLLCEIKNSLTENVYDKSDFVRTAVSPISYGDNEPFYFVFSANVNRNIRQFGKVLYASLMDAYKYGEFDYSFYKEKLLEGYVPAGALNLKNIDPEIFRKITRSQGFELLDGVFTSVINERVPVMDVSERLNSILKLKKQDILPYSQAAYNGLGYDGCSVDIYLDSDFSTAQVKNVKAILDEAKNRMVNDFMLEELSKK